MGEQLHRYACGEDDNPVSSAFAEEELKSVGNGMTFRRNLVGEEDIKQGVIALSDSIASRMRHHGVKCATVQVMIKDPEFKTISRQKALLKPTHLAKEITQTTMEIIKGSWDLSLPIRMLTVTGCNLVKGSQREQISLFGEENVNAQKQESLENTIDVIHIKYGKSAIGSAAVMENDIGIEINEY